MLSSWRTHLAVKMRFRSVLLLEAEQAAVVVAAAALLPWRRL